MATKKPPKLKTIIRRLDKKFSRMRRLQNASPEGYCDCISCGTTNHWKEMDAGHFVERDCWWTRYTKMNVWPQCIPCNRFKGGRTSWYGKVLREKFGNDPIDDMVALSKKADLRTSVDKKLWLLEIEKEVDLELKDLGE